MTGFRAIVFSAVLSGLIVGALVTLAQRVAIIPLIQQAEVFERRAESAASSHAGPATATQAPVTHDHAAHEHGTAAWEPSEGLERTAYTALFNAIDWIGFGLLLNGAFVLLHRPACWREGLLWGLGGYAAFVIAPGFGVPPELPGMPAGPLLQRQLWWLFTVVTTAAGLGLIGLRRTPPAAVAGILLLMAPHLVGAPPFPAGDREVPDDLARRFVVAVTVTALPCWALLGALTGHFHRRFNLPA